MATTAIGSRVHEVLTISGVLTSCVPEALVSQNALRRTARAVAHGRLDAPRQSSTSERRKSVQLLHGNATVGAARPNAEHSFRPSR
jgi:hypothetical protein